MEGLILVVVEEAAGMLPQLLVSGAMVVQG